MARADLRAEPRVSVSCHGTLRLGESSAPCFIQNMCSRGFLIRSSKELPVGKILQLRCELDPERTVECTVEVRHVNRDCLGARVIEISDDGRILCKRFLEEQHALQRGGSDAARPAA
jgi:PilZ domain